MFGKEPTAPSSWIKRLQSRSFALVLAIPLLFGIFLFEKFQSLRFKTMEDESRRFLVDCANSMAEELSPSRALSSAFQTLFPDDFEPLNRRFPLEFALFQNKASFPSQPLSFLKKSLSFTAKKTLDALSPYLKKTEQGVRIFMFDVEGNLRFAHSPPELIASNSELWRGANYSVFADQTISPAPLLEVASKAWDILLRRFSNRVLFSELMLSSSFDLVIPTEYSSATCFLVQAMRGGPGILIEIDQENLDRDAILQRALDQWFPGVELAALIDGNGLTQRMNVRGPFSPDQSFPIPGKENSVEFYPEGFFVKRPLEGGAYLILGTGPPTLFSMSSTTRLMLETLLVLSFLIFSRRLGESLTEESGEAHISLSWQLAGLFFIAALVPLLTLIFFGFHQAFESPRAEEMSWVGRMHRKLLGIDRCFHQAKERFQGKLHGMATKLGSVAGEGKSLESSFHRSNILDLFFMDCFGHGYATVTAKEMASYPSNKLILSLLKSYLRHYQRALGQEKNSGKPDIPDVMEVYLEEALRMNSPVRDFFFNQRRVSQFKVFTGETMTSYAEVVMSPGGLLQGVFMSFIHIPQLLQKVVFRGIMKKKQNPLMNLFALQQLKRETRLYQNAESNRVLPLLQKSSERQTEMQSRYMEDGRTFLFLSTTPSFIQNVTLGVSVDLAHISRRIRAHVRELAFLTILGAVIILYVGFLIRRHLLVPLQILRSGVERISQGYLSTRLPVESGDELGQLLGTFNQMADGLQQRERMKRFVSREVWATTQTEQMAESSAIKKLDAAILFCDIRGFTTMSEKMPAPDVVALLNEYFSSMDTVIRRYGGEIDKLIGDAILAIFRPEPGKPDPANRAVMAGLAMRATLSHFNRRREAAGKVPIEIGTGIHFGPLIEGRVGSARGRLDLTVVGPALNQAMRLEGASKRGKATRIIVSAETALHLKGEFPLVALEGDETGLQEILKPWDTILPEIRPEEGKP